MIINNKQFETLDKIKVDEFLKRVSGFLEQQFDNELLKQKLNGSILTDFILKNYFLSKNFRLTKEDSIAAYILLSLLNGEHFLDTRKFSIYKYYMNRSDYDPNVYIFNIPSLS